MVISPFFLMEEEKKINDEIDEYSIITINADTSDLVTYTLPKYNKNEDQLVFMNQTTGSNEYQNLFLIKKKEKNQQSQDRTKTRIKLFLQESENIVVYFMEDLPKKIGNPAVARSIYCTDNYIYFIYKNRIVTVDIEKNTSQTVVYHDNLSDIEVCDNSYFYWRATESGTNYYSIKSFIFFDYLANIADLKDKQALQNFKKHYSISEGILPHISKIY
mmetsp:Transcript_33817/g.32921  ORF Transcript_33817/g.32921 Transcript_33817/m.32921 type:complete len:217 (-) Transcript_33817:193-843(-)